MTEAEFLKGYFEGDSDDELSCRRRDIEADLAGQSFLSEQESRQALDLIRKEQARRSEKGGRPVKDRETAPFEGALTRTEDGEVLMTTGALPLAGQKPAARIFINGHAYVPYEAVHNAVMAERERCAHVAATVAEPQTTQTLKLALGEMTAQELRTLRAGAALIAGIIGRVK